MYDIFESMKGEEHKTLRGWGLKYNFAVMHILKQSLLDTCKDYFVSNASCMYKTVHIK